MFMINRCVPSAYIFFIASTATQVIANAESVFLDKKIKHSSWTSIVIAAKYFKHLADNVQ